MEILLLVTIIVVGVSGLYVAATFNRRTRQNAAPLVNEAVKGISRHVADTGENLSQQLHEIDVQMQQERELIDQDIARTQERLDHADMRLSSIAGQLSAELDTIKHQCAQIAASQDHFGGILRQQLDQQGAQLGESLARLSAQVAGIESYLRSQPTQAAANLGRVEGSIRDMGEGPQNSQN
jgi:chromosome segregation ATPase